MACGDFKDLKRTTASDNVLSDKAFNIAKNPKYDGYQRGLASMVYKCFYKKFALLTDKSVSGSGINVPLELRKDLCKPVIKKFILDLKMIFGELI